MSEAELDAAFEAAWSNEGFMSCDHEEARLTAGRAALRRFREAQLQPGAVIPTYVEREFAFMLGGDRVRGRWDRVDVVATEGGPRPTAAPPASGTADRPSADVVSPTLGILGPERVTITDYIGEVEVDPRRLATARDRIATAAAGMRARDYTPKPDYLACTYCAFRDICPSSVAR